MATTTVADYLLRRLREWGVNKVFGFPGDGINGILAAWGRAENNPKFIQARHEEMSAFEAVGYAKFTGRFGVCMATSGPGAVHLLNGLYDAKLDHVPVIAIAGQTSRSAMGGSYQQEVDLLSLFKDVASEYVQMVTVPEPAAWRAGPGHPCRAHRACADGDHHPLRRPGAGVLGADACVQDGPVQHRGRLAHRHTRRRRDRPRGGDPQRRPEGSNLRQARARAGHARNCSRSLNCWGPG